MPTVRRAAPVSRYKGDRDLYRMVNAIREILGLAPLLGERQTTDLERFNVDPHTTSTGRTPRRQAQ